MVDEIFSSVMFVGPHRKLAKSGRMADSGGPKNHTKNDSWELKIMSKTDPNINISYTVGKLPSY